MSFVFLEMGKNPTFHITNASTKLIALCMKCSQKLSMWAKSTFWLEKLIAWWKPVSIYCRVWTWRHYVNVHRTLLRTTGCVYVWQIPFQAQNYSFPFEAEISIWYAQNKVRKLAYQFPELFSSYHCRSLSNGEKNPTETFKETILLKQEQKIPRK